MAVNPTLAQDGQSKELFPLHQSGEAFALKRDNIDFECALPRGKLWGKGSFFLSAKRMVFIATHRSCRSDFKSFEIPMNKLLEPKFNQPIFGANYLSGKSIPEDRSGPLGPDPVYWTLTFNSGGCGTFLPVFFTLLAEQQQEHQSASGSYAQAAQDGRLGQVAYMDPSDPSVLFLTQPEPVPESQETTVFQPVPPAEAIPAPSAPPLGGRPNAAQNCAVM